MAFVNRIGSVLKYTLKNTNVETCASNPSVYQAIRCISTSKIFVGGISYGTDEMGLREAFARYGEIVDARIVTDRDSGRSRGFAFITFATSEDASSAIQAMDGQELHGRKIRVNYGTEKSVPGFGRGASGGYAGDKFSSNVNYGAESYGKRDDGGSGNYR